MRTRLLVPLGVPDHASGGDMSSPSQVYFVGIGAPSTKAGEFRRKVMLSSASIGKANRALKADGNPYIGFAVLSWKSKSLHQRRRPGFRLAYYAGFAQPRGLRMSSSKASFYNPHCCICSRQQLAPYVERIGVMGASL